MTLLTRRCHRTSTFICLMMTTALVYSSFFTASAFFLSRQQRSLIRLPSETPPSKPERNRIRLPSNVASKQHESTTLPAVHERKSGDFVSSASGLLPSSSSSQGRFILCFVALLYGTLNVSLRAVYGGVPQPPSAATLSVTRGWLATVCFFVVSSVSSSPSPSLTSKVSGGDIISPDTKNYDNRSLALAGLELAIWNGLAQGLLNAGLLSTGSARASFLTQTSVVWTPILLTLCVGRQSVSASTWLGCAIALCGLTLLSSGSTGDGAIAAIAFSMGDVFVLGGALAWSAYLIRLGKIGDRFPEIPLQFVKTFLLGILYTLWFVLGLFDGTGSPISNFSTSMAWAVGPGALAAWGALVYSAVGPGALADVLQQQGQRTVPPSQANVLLSLEPVFAALCARLLLGEVTTLNENIGGSLIVLAALVTTVAASFSDKSPNESVKE